MLQGKWNKKGMHTEWPFKVIRLLSLMSQTRLILQFHVWLYLCVSAQSSGARPWSSSCLGSGWHSWYRIQSSAKAISWPQHAHTHTHLGANTHEQMDSTIKGEGTSNVTAAATQARWEEGFLSKGGLHEAHSQSEVYLKQSSREWRQRQQRWTALSLEFNVTGSMSRDPPILLAPLLESCLTETTDAAY